MPVVVLGGNLFTFTLEPPTEELPPGLIPDKRTSPNGIHHEKTALQPRKSTDSPLTRA